MACGLYLNLGNVHTFAMDAKFSFEFSAALQALRKSERDLYNMMKNVEISRHATSCRPKIP